MKKKMFLGVLLVGVLFGMTGCGTKLDYSALDKIVSGMKEDVVSGKNEGNKNVEVYTRNNISEATVGDYVVFGSYEQDNDLNNGKEQIEWIVLDEKEGQKLLISRYILDSRCYSDEPFQKWETSSLRRWLNEDFYTEAFSEKDKKYIAATSLNNPDNMYYEELVKPYGTVDVIFLLGAEESEIYKNANDTAWIMREGIIPTAYAQANGLRLLTMSEQEESYWCYLRSCGYHHAYAALISTNGAIDRGGISITEEGLGIRPALWVYEEEQAKEPSYFPVGKKEDQSVTENSGGLVVEENTVQEDVKQEIEQNPSEQEPEEEFKFISFGKYEQDNNINNGKEEIEWIVLEDENGEALLLSRYILDVNQIEEFYGIWEERPLRTWLNEEFYNAAFSDAEKNKIIKVRLKNPDNDGYIVSAGATEEYVSLMSVNEVKRYFGEDDSVYENPRLATCATKYAVAKGIGVNEYGGVGEGNSAWDLRSNGYHEGYVAWVSDSGVIYNGGHAQAQGTGIRPMIKIRYMDENEFEEVVYKNAIHFFESGEYEKAEECFLKLNETENVLEKINECRYMRAKQLYDSGEFGKSKVLYSQIVNYKDAKDLKVLAEKQELKQIEIGGSYLLGSYEQDDNDKNGAEPIEWQVLDVKEDKILLISKYVLDAQKYDDDWAVWEDSFIREWLNGEFYDNVFSDEEKAKIVETKLKNSDSYLEPDDISADTSDKVFLLSVNEAIQYFDENVGFENPSRTAAPTAYAIARGVNINASDAKDAKCWWHLRSNGVHEGLVMQINVWGQMIDINKDWSDRGVRPAIWMTRE